MMNANRPNFKILGMMGKPGVWELGSDKIRPPSEKAHSWLLSKNHCRTRAAASHCELVVVVVRSATGLGIHCQGRTRLLKD